MSGASLSLTVPMARATISAFQAGAERGSRGHCPSQVSSCEETAITCYSTFSTAFSFLFSFGIINVKEVGIMAHVAKFAGPVALAEIGHCARTEKNANKNVDRDRTPENTYLFPMDTPRGDQVVLETYQEDVADRYKDRMKDVYVYGNRPDINTLCSLVVTCPREITDRAEQDKVMKAAVRFAADQVGAENVVAGCVHRDEPKAQPHVHVLFIPVVHDAKKDRDKVAANKIVTKKWLRELHPALSRYVSRELGREISMTSGITRELGGNRSISQLRYDTAEEAAENAGKEAQEARRAAREAEAMARAAQEEAAAKIAEIAVLRAGLEEDRKRVGEQKKKAAELEKEALESRERADAAMTAAREMMDAAEKDRQQAAEDREAAAALRAGLDEQSRQLDARAAALLDEQEKLQADWETAVAVRKAAENDRIQLEKDRIQLDADRRLLELSVSQASANRRKVFSELEKDGFPPDFCDLIEKEVPVVQAAAAAKILRDERHKIGEKILECVDKIGIEEIDGTGDFLVKYDKNQVREYAKLIGRSVSKAVDDSYLCAIMRRDQILDVDHREYYDRFDPKEQRRYKMRALKNAFDPPLEKLNVITYAMLKDRCENGAFKALSVDRYKAEQEKIRQVAEKKKEAVKTYKPRDWGLER